MPVLLMQSILIKSGTLLTVDAHDTIVRGNLLIRDGRIASVGESEQNADIVLDASGCAVLPGFVQTHLHFCQTIFRGAADDLSLLDWLKKRVWPLEAAHNAASVRASAQLAVAELIKGGTTCALTMETVSHTEEVFKVVEETGFRAIVGKCMMDQGEDVPTGLHEQTQESIGLSLDLLQRWHGQADGRIGFCFAPRFALSCSKELLTEVGKLAREKGVIVHTHASENKNECQIVEGSTGLRNVTYLNEVGLTGTNVVLAHCVHLDDEEFKLLRDTRTNVAHCPSSNLKLGSGIADVNRMLNENISVSLGADGSACNNRLDMFTEMRTMALLQKVVHGPEVVNAAQALRIATAGGAVALGLASEIGSLEVGKRADVIVLDLQKLHTSPASSEIVSSLVYAAEASDVRDVIIDGHLVMRDRNLNALNEAAVIGEANRERLALLARAGINN